MSVEGALVKITLIGECRTTTSSQTNLMAPEANGINIKNALIIRGPWTSVDIAGEHSTTHRMLLNHKCEDDVQKGN